MNYRLTLLALAVLAFPLLRAPAETSPETQRLIDIARLWVTVEYFHPYLGYKNLAWDQALTDALPKLRSARTPRDYAAALNLMLGRLSDTETSAWVEGQVPKASSMSATGSAQRSRFHHGLAPAGGAPSSFYTGFLIKPNALPASVTLPMGMQVSARIRLSEPAGQDESLTTKVEAAEIGAYPNEAGRILAAFRLWGAVRYFFAYKDLMDEDWDRVFAEYLPRFIAAKDAREYDLTAAELVSHLSDSGAAVESAELAKYFGEASPAIEVRLVEKKPVVVYVSREAQAAGVRVGDLVTSVDGENIVERIKREANYLSASTPASLSDLVARRLLNGPAESKATLGISRADRPESIAELPRAISKNQLPERENSEAVRLLPGNTSYVDLDKLSESDVDATFEKIRNTRGVVFDLRGTCRPGGEAIASRLAAKSGIQASVITGPIATEPDVARSGIETSTASYFVIRTVPVSPKWKYQGKVVLLVDERTRGRAEAAALMIAAASKAHIVGTPSAGAPAETTDIMLPGGLKITFSGEDVRLLNGGQLQRSGVQPNLSVPTTLAAIRAGRDEAFEKALQGLREITQE